MLCLKPFSSSAGTFPCGQCLPCRINRRRVWTHRLLLESHLHGSSVFATLTYDNAKLPLTGGSNSHTSMATLVPKDAQDWLKRLRKSIAPIKIRYFLVGEYGDQTERPHYHAALFNFPKCVRVRTLRRVETKSRPVWRECCPSCRLVGTTWGHGDVDLGSLETDSAQYLAGYVTKKMTSATDDRLYGRHPEFARMSLKPGIGADFMDNVADTLLGPGSPGPSAEGDVPSALRHGSRIMPIGPYLQRKLREKVGMDPRSPATLSAEGAYLHRLSKPAPLTKEETAQKISNLLKRREIFSKDRKL